MAAVLTLAPVLAAQGARAASPHVPRVVASIKPVQSLVAGVMAGVGTPALVVRGAGSPHDYSLRPSEARALANAQVVFWIGPDLELFMRGPLRALAGHARVVALGAAPGVVRLPQREGGAWGADEGAPKGHHASNPHVWLDPRNAEAMVSAIAATLARADPPHAEVYRANADILRERLRALDRELARSLAPIRERPFLVFHDAYAYLEHRYGLHAVGSVTVEPSRPPGARRVLELRERIRSAGAVCVFAEPEFRPHLVDTLVEDTGARAAVLDPLGAELEEGQDLYFKLMRNLANALRGCLGDH